MKIEGRSIIVTGGARGIGLASARMLLQEGANVTIAATSEQSIAEARTRLGDTGRLAGIAADVCTAAGAEAVAQRALTCFGAIDGLFTNAGAYAEGPIEALDMDTWNAVLATNLTSCMLSIQAALPALRRARGAIVTMSSFNGITGVPGSVSAYGAAKAGIVNLTRSLALDLAPEVRVNCLAPGFVETEKLLAMPESQQMIAGLSQMTPVGRIGRGEEIAHALVFALENEFVNGATINIDGGRIAGAYG